ncbi:MAG: molybdenum cofactor guanylyltransferase [Gallionella sp.]|nr:molybdenum cofactor guanylyltransferase [Gallionella sp.]
MIDDCTAIVMAGGDSRRMGTDKANVTLGEKTLLQSVIATMQQLFPQVIVSVRQPRAGIDLPQVCDEQPDGGPLAGLVASLGQITTPWAFMVACDMPFVVPEVVELLAGYRFKPPSVPPCQGESDYSSPDKTTSHSTWSSKNDDQVAGYDKGRLGGVLYQAVVPVVHGHPQPLAAFYAASCLAPLRTSLAAQQKGLCGVLKQLDVCYVDEAEMLKADPQLRSFFDLDTPQDVEAAMNGVR